MSDAEGESNSGNLEEIKDTDVTYYVLLAELQGDPQTYKETINSDEKDEWSIQAIQTELNSLEGKGVFEVVNRSEIEKIDKKANILDSRWEFKGKINEEGKIKYKARLVIRGYKNKNDYELRETYAPVSRLAIVRSFLAIANKKKCHLSKWM